jgi:hypothetical protein
MSSVRPYYCMGASFMQLQRHGRGTHVVRFRHGVVPQWLGRFLRPVRRSIAQHAATRHLRRTAWYLRYQSDNCSLYPQGKSKPVQKR